MRVRINTHGNPVPEQHGGFIELRTAHDVYMKAGEDGLISLGVSIEIPGGYYAEMLPRYDTFRRWGITMANGIEVIDQSRYGCIDVWKFHACATRDVFVPKGTSIAQCRFVEKQMLVEFVLEEKHAGGNGVGHSTG